MLFGNKNKIKPLILCILDGWGYASPWGGNAVSEANTPNFDRLWRDFPHTLLLSSGEAVGLPGHEMGNSEVGHLNLGAGRVVRQDILRINSSIEDRSFFQNPVLKAAVSHAEKFGSKIHLLGLLSDGGVHSHIDHLFALLDFFKNQNVRAPVFIHAITDGRDTDPMSGLQFFDKLLRKLKETGLGNVATIAGRYYAMDRDHRFERTSLAYENMVNGSDSAVSSPLKAMSAYYAKGITDEFIPPTLINHDGLISDNDAIVFFNFRADRARQITTFLVDSQFRQYRRSKILKGIFFVSMIPYYERDMGVNLPIHSAFAPELLPNTLSEIFSENKLRQFHTAETEKYAHVTYFFNGAREEAFPGEDRALVHSPKVATYNLMPEMSADGVLMETLKAIDRGIYSFILTNFANADMVGHTGDLKATILACEKVDECLGKVILETEKLGGVLLVTADHGNAEEMINLETGTPQTEHTTNPVPFILVDKKFSLRPTPGASLSYVAPTICDIIKLKKPQEMTGSGLISKNGVAVVGNDVIEYKV